MLQVRLITNYKEKGRGREGKGGEGREGKGGEERGRGGEGGNKVCQTAREEKEMKR